MVRVVADSTPRPAVCFDSILRLQEECPLVLERRLEGLFAPWAQLAILRQHSCAGVPEQKRVVIPRERIASAFSMSYGPKYRNSFRSKPLRVLR
jgi:hypothetical protein